MGARTVVDGVRFLTFVRFGRDCGRLTCLGISLCPDAGEVGKERFAVELHGHKKQPIEKPIPAHIKAQIVAQRCVVLYTSNPECDHKDGRRDDPRLSDASRVTIDDFQPLSKAANNAKRQHCRECRETGRRFDARQLGFAVAQTKGNGAYRGSCVGCYWYDVRQFRGDVGTERASA